jgi:hypothetical protein
MVFLLLLLVGFVLDSWHFEDEEEEEDEDDRIKKEDRACTRSSVSKIASQAYCTAR